MDTTTTLGHFVLLIFRPRGFETFDALTFLHLGMILWPADSSGFLDKFTMLLVKMTMKNKASLRSNQSDHDEFGVFQKFQGTLA